MMNSLHFVLDQLAGFSYKCVCWPTFPLKQKWRHPGEATGAFCHCRNRELLQQLHEYGVETNTQKIKYVLALILCASGRGGDTKKTMHRKCRLMIFPAEIFQESRKGL